MAVAFLNTNTMQRAIASPVTDTTHMSVTASGANRCAFIVIVYDQAAGMSVSAVTYGGQTCTPAGSASHGTVGNEYAEVWYLVNPPTGLNTLSITVAGTVADIFYNVVAFTGVNQTTPIRAGTYQSGTNQSSTAGTFSMVVASNTNDLTLTAINGGNAGVGATNQTGDGTSNAGTYGAGSDHATTAATSVTHSWGIAGTQEVAAVGFSINGDPNNAGGGWSGSGTRRAPAKAGPFDQRGFILSPYQQYSYVSSAPLNAYTLTASPGAFALSGNAANLLAGHVVTASLATFALTGNAANLLWGHVVTAAKGTFSESGVAAALDEGHLLGASTGVFVLSGIAAALSKGRTLTASAGAFTLAGQPAALVRAAVLSSLGGAFALAGIAANLIEGRLLTAATGSFALNGNAATLTQGKGLTASLGTFALSGVAATLSAPARLVADSGTFAVAGQAAGLVAPSAPSTGGGGAHAWYYAAAAALRNAQARPPERTKEKAPPRLRDYTVGAEAGALGAQGAVAALIANRSVAGVAQLRLENGRAHLALTPSEDEESFLAAMAFFDFAA